jgi:hypothetical protein
MIRASLAIFDGGGGGTMVKNSALETTLFYLFTFKRVYQLFSVFIVCFLIGFNAAFKRAVNVYTKFIWTQNKFFCTVQLYF